MPKGTQDFLPVGGADRPVASCRCQCFRSVGEVGVRLTGRQALLLFRQIGYGKGRRRLHSRQQHRTATFGYGYRERERERELRGGLKPAKIAALTDSRMSPLRPTTVGGADARDVGGIPSYIIALAKERESVAILAQVVNFAWRPCIGGETGG